MLLLSCSLNLVFAAARNGISLMRDVEVFITDGFRLIQIDNKGEIKFSKL